MKGKRILLGITGGIAAYKIATLIRILKKSEAEVKCIMTPASCDFISPLVVATLSGNDVGIEFWNHQTGTWANHVEYGLWADVMIIAPLTATSMSKMAMGSCDNLLLATYLSAKCPVIVAPAMDLDMFAHPTSKRNLKQLVDDGVQVIPAEVGELASGLHGEGRMAEAETIAKHIQWHFDKQGAWKDKKVFITAGPTYEKIDPVRFIGNHSSGKMGYEIADQCLKLGAKVVLISGPTNLNLVHPNLEIINVQSAEEMLHETKKYWLDADIGIFAAAVADYKVENPAEQKIKKKTEQLKLDLVKNPDILAWAGSVKKSNQILGGFALETNNAIENAQTKLEAKNLDFVVLNTLEDLGAGFAHDTNKIYIVNHNNLIKFELKSKREVAQDIVNYINENIQ